MISKIWLLLFLKSMHLIQENKEEKKHYVFDS